MRTLPSPIVEIASDRKARLKIDNEALGEVRKETRNEIHDEAPDENKLLDEIGADQETAFLSRNVNTVEIIISASIVDTQAIQFKIAPTHLTRTEHPPRAMIRPNPNLQKHTLANV
jgi:hypothetical protein